MKRFSLLVIVILITNLFTNAQEQENVKKNNNTAGFHFGLKVSPAMSWIKPDIKTISYEGSRININGGLITDFNFTNNYAFSTGFEIISFGGKLGYPNSTADSVYYIPSEDTIPFLLLNRTYRLRYVNLPLTLKLKTNQIGSMVYYGQFGFDMGLRWRALADDEGYQKRITTTNKDVTVQEDVSFFRLSLNVGLGVEYNLAGNTSLLIGANYNNGFTNAFRKESKVLANKNGSRLKQNAFANYVALSVGVLF